MMYPIRAIIPTSAKNPKKNIKRFLRPLIIGVTINIKINNKTAIIANAVSTNPNRVRATKSLADKNLAIILTIILRTNPNARKQSIIIGENITKRAIIGVINNITHINLPIIIMVLSRLKILRRAFLVFCILLILLISLSILFKTGYILSIFFATPLVLIRRRFFIIEIKLSVITSIAPIFFIRVSASIVFNPEFSSQLPKSIIDPTVFLKSNIFHLSTNNFLILIFLSSSIDSLTDFITSTIGSIGLSLKSAKALLFLVCFII